MLPSYRPSIVIPSKQLDSQQDLIFLCQNVSRMPRELSTINCSSPFTLFAQMKFMAMWGIANLLHPKCSGKTWPHPRAPASAVPVARCCAVAPSQRFAALVLWPRPGLAQVAERRRRQMLTTTGLKIMRKDVQLKKDVHQIIRHLSWLDHS